jgi:Ca2+-binding RTX toxin-like protein
VTNGVTDVLSNTEEAVITGTTSADLIDAWGFTGRVTLVGDAGSDEFRVGTGGGSLFGDAGVDSLRVLGDSDYQLSDTQLNLTGLGQNYALNSTESVSITAGALANNLDASAYSGSVTLVGAGGADSLKGGQGDDLLLGGDSNDQLGGGAGADTLDGGNDTTGDVWIEAGAVTVTLVALGFPSVPVDSVSGLERANFTGDGSPNIFNLTTFAGTASLKGGAGNDVLTGGTMADTLEGEAGDDTLTGSGALDSLLGGGGTDRLLGFGDTQFDLTDDRLDGPGTGLDTLSSIEEAVLTGFGGSSRFDASAFSGPVTLIGGDGADTLIGGLVADSLVGDGGDDRLEGRDGNDTLTGLAGNDFMDGGLGTDLLNGFVGNDTLLGDDGNDTLIGAEGSDSVVGGADNDLLSHSFDVVTTTVGLTMDDTLRGGPGLDTLEGGAGYDVVEEIGDSNYTLTNVLLQSTLGNDTLSEFEAARLVGGASPNLFNTLVFTGPVTLDGQDADDTFLAGAQNDSLIGGPGSGDQLHASGDFSFTLSDVLLTGLGNDSLSLVEQAVITGGVSANNLNAGAFTLGPVTLTGLAGNDTVTGGSGSDSLDAGDGDDTVTGNAGANTLLGGTGTNMLIEASDVHFTLTNSLLTGTTTVPGAGLTDQLSNFALAQLTGGSGPNLINASAFTGSVTLDGGAGDDTLLGALGSDWLRGSADVDQVAAAADVDFTLINTLLSGLGSDTLENIERASLTGGAGANRLDAGAFTSGAVTLVGAGGNDTLIGGQQSDSLDGGPGDNSFTGGDGDDLFLGGTGLDLVEDSVSGGGSFVLTATLLTGRGTDTLLSIDRARLTGGSAGNSLNAANATVPVTLMGGPGNDTLVAGPQNDSLNGGTDDDILTGGAGRDTLDAGAGSNDLLLETINANTLTLNNAALIADFIGIPDTPVSDVLVGNQFEKANLTGGALNNLIDASSFSGPVTLNGLGGDDTLRGNNSSADSLDGGAGNDSLEGLNGADTLRGGTGNDTLKGADGANVLDGQDGNDTLLGGPGGETLLGGAGNDSMTALAGDDSIDGQAGTDLLTELVSGNVVLTDTSMTGLGNDTLASIELVQLTGGATDDTLDASGYTLGTVTLSGLSGNDILRGGALADSLLGGDGDDSLTGNGGNDLVDGGLGTDWVVETANGLLVLTNTGLTSTSNGTDTHLSIERASLSGGAGNDTLDASAYTLSPVILHGGGGSDSLIGTSLNDSLLGDGGDDFLDGRLGDDSLTGGTETDAAVAAGDLSFTVTATSLVGNGADALAPDVDSVSLTGGAGANTFDLFNWPGLATITGGSGADLLQVGGSLADDNFLLEADRIIRGAATIYFAEVETLVVNAGDGNDTLVIADSVAAGAAADGAAISTLTVSNVTLAGGNGDDLFHMLPQSSLLVHVAGGPHAIGDTLEYDASSVALDQQPGLLLPEGKQPTSYVEIEVLDLLRNWLYKVFVPLINRLP